MVRKLKWKENKMAWTDLFIKRPVFSVSLAALLMFAGLFGYAYLPLRLFPKIEIPMINISVDYPGASSATMEGFVTNTIENALTGINGINYMTSSSSQGHVDIIVYMNIGTNADLALMNVMQKVAGVGGQLPQGIDEPIISKAESDDNPVLLLAFTSDQLSRSQISDYLNRAVKPQLEAIDGVANAQVLGGQYAMRLWLNPKAMAAYGLTMQDVIGSLNNQNVQSTVGSIDGKTQQNITLNSELDTAESFNQLVIKQSGDSVIHLSDIGEAKLGDETNKINAFYNGKPAVMVFVKPEAGANPLAAVDSIEKILPNIKQQLPNGLSLNTVVNAATYIRASINEVMKTMLEAIVVVVLVIFLFLGDLRSVLIPLVTIPLSLIGVCFFLMLMGYSINLLTLLAMVIAIGLVVDDAIVVMENIHRYIEQGYSILQAALIGTREIAFSVISMTLTLAVICIPIAFSSGITGKLFSEFAWTLAGTVILSGVIALTLSPMMCAMVMRDRQSESNFMHLIERVFETLKNTYLICLKKVFQYKRVIIVLWLVSLGACVYFYQSTPQELSPKEDEGFLQVIATVPDSSNTQFLADNSAKLDAIYRSIPEIQSAIYINGIPSEHQVLSFVRLIPWDKRKLSSLALQPLLQAKLNQIAGLQSVAVVPSVLPGTQGFPVQFVIKSMDDYKALYGASEQLMQAARQSGLFLFVDDDLNYDQPVLKMTIDRDAATAMGVNVGDITQTLATALNENKVQYFNLSGRSYQVIPQIYESDRLNPDQLNQLNVRAQNNTLVPLSALISMKTVTEPASLNQFQKFNSVTISAVMTPGHTLSEGLNFLNKTTNKLLPKTMHADYAGNSRQFVQEGHHMLWLFLSAFVMIFIVLAMQFESFKDPLIILLGSLPMALMAALLPLKFGFATINIYTQIGLLTLAGLVSKHGILLTKFANNEQLKGRSKYRAIMQAASIRFRPILMTTLAIVFGVLPLVFAGGAGAISRFDIGIVIVVGMFFGTLFTLFVVPILYHYLASHRVVKDQSSQGEI
jgi:multidrug efflux pump